MMKKKICFFINSGWYFELHWLDRAKLFLDDYEIHVLAHFTQSEKLKLESMGFTCHETCMSERTLNPFLAILDFYRIIKILKKIKPSLIHAVTIKPIMIAGVYSRVLKIPFIASFVGLGRVFMNSSALYKVLNFIVCCSYAFIFKNKKSKLTFEHNQDLEILSSKITVMPDQCVVIDGVGVDLNEYSFSIENFNNPPIVLFAGRLLKSKGLEVLVDINKELTLKGYGFILNVAGIQISDDRDAISNDLILKWHDSGLINWLGQRNDIPSLIDECNIIALPSIYFEGVPRFLIEGAAKGRACIAFDSGGCSSIIKNEVNGYLVDKGNKDEFKTKLIALLSCRKLRNVMGNEGRKIVEQRFSLQQVYIKTKNLYREII